MLHEEEAEVDEEDEDKTGEAEMEEEESTIEEMQIDLKMSREIIMTTEIREKDAEDPAEAEEIAEFKEVAGDNQAVVEAKTVMMGDIKITRETGARKTVEIGK
jgi:hypothetical protein